MTLEQLTENFHESEFVKPGTKPNTTQRANIKKIAIELQKIRKIFGKPIYITSGWRTILHNLKVGGVWNSLHLRGLAVDFTVFGFTPLAVQRRLHKTWPGGLGCYKTFTHIDLGPFKRWGENLNSVIGK